MAAETETETETETAAQTETVEGRDVLRVVLLLLA
jgi:hypothetical protein